MGIIKKHIELLGHRATDRVTNFSGVITTVSFDLYGCIQVVVTPPVGGNGNSENHYPSSHWFDITRLDVSKERVMELPNFKKGYVAKGNKGPAEKPLERTL